MHVELPEQLLRELKTILPSLGYSSISEFVREMARRTTRENASEKRQSEQVQSSYK